MAEVLRTLHLRGFDPAGEPSIRLMDDGSLAVLFEFMPPSDTADGVDLGRFAHFDREMERAVGVPVLWEDREFFRIERPNPDTVDRLRAFVEGYRNSGRP